MRRGVSAGRGSTRGVYWMRDDHVRFYERMLRRLASLPADSPRREWLRGKVIEGFVPLADRLARRYASRGESMEDLQQVARVGLVKAVDGFDPELGGFLGYAVPTILGELKRYFRNTGWSVHVPRGAQEMALRVDRAARHIAARSGRHARVEEIAEYLEVTSEDVLTGLDAGTAHYSISLDAPVSAGDGEEPDALGDSIGRDDDRYALVETAAALSAAVARLPYPERRALALRLDEDMKQTEIAKELGCSQMQVSRLLRRAASRLREMTDMEAPARR